MKIYRKICYKVEDLFIKMMTRKQEPEEVQAKVQAFRQQRESVKQNKKQAKLEKAE
ncbi:hypothetical protein [Domibacillus aminovorans]|uniref:hypothetical protein n=1 Tax=Domibacillus aminovorans TaxID=29332 RepID=UPI0012FE2717|nr:hypothetical protein [Domibacillus aminovorans]